MHKVFISYHHGNDQRYKDELVSMAEENKIFVDRSVDTSNIPDNLSSEAIRKKIRDNYLKDSTVTIILVGTKTRNRKHVDWEIHGSMYESPGRIQSGILAIMLPKCGASRIHAPHGKKEKDLYPCKVWESLGGRAEYERAYPQMPVRLIDNLFRSNSPISVVPWPMAVSDVNILRNLVDIAYNDRKQCKYDTHRPLRRANS